MPVALRPALAGLPSYQPGKPAPGGAGGVSYKLSSNENPFPPLPGVLAAAEQACRSMNRYPDMANSALTEALAAHLGVSADRLAFGTGSVAVLYHLLQAVCGPGEEVVYAWRSFEAYPIAVRLTGAVGVPVPLTASAEHDLSAMRAAVTPATKAILLCSPNNPTGPALRHAEVVDLVDSLPDHILVVLDEAYVEFVRNSNGLRGLEVERPNVVVLRTFSKAYGLAGFRVGYCVADARLAGAVRTVALPFGVSLPAQAAAVTSLAAVDQLLERVERLVVARDELAAGLRSLQLSVPDAQGNFVWLPAGERTLEYAQCFAEAGVMVRPYAAGEPGDGVRITVGEPEANRLVLEVAARLPR